MRNVHMTSTRYAIARIFGLALVVSLAARGTPADEEAARYRAAETAAARQAELQSIETKIAATLHKASATVVRVAWGKDDLEGSASGVIITPDGHVVTSFLTPLSYGTAVAVYLLDGRRVTGKALGHYEAISLIKIDDAGPWPHAILGQSAAMLLGDVCVALGYPHLDSVGYPRLDSVGSLPTHDQAPALRLGHVCCAAGAPHWLSSSCRVANTDRGGGLFDLEGRLVALHIPVLLQHAPRHHAVHVGIEIFEAHWDELTDSTQAEAVAQEATRESPAGRNRRVSKGAIEKARRATVGVAFDERGEFGCSGTIVSADGYVVTCQHHHFSTGHAVRLYLADGRTVAGKILRLDPVLDICLVKITDEGDWPYVDFGKSITAQGHDPCIALGYPSSRPDLGGKSRWSSALLRHGHIRVPLADPRFVNASCRIRGGDSGGGLFDAQGRILGTHMSRDTSRNLSSHTRIEFFERHWDFLAGEEPMPELPTGDLGKTATSFREAVAPAPAVAVEILGDGKRRALGTIVGSDGWVLTKASELYGELACRLRDGRVLPAVVRGVSREHDLALLKMEVGDLPEARWTGQATIEVGTIVGALGCTMPTAVGVVSEPLRAFPREPGWMSVYRKIEDTPRGLTVREVGEFNPESPLRIGDIIVHVEGQPTPDLKTYVALTEKPGVGVASVIAGDPIRVGIRRGDQVLELRFPLPSESSTDAWESKSNRRSAFPKVFASDVPIAPDRCGGPMLDRQGRVVGVTVACRTHGRVYVVPAALAREVAEALRMGATHD